MDGEPVPLLARGQAGEGRMARTSERPWRQTDGRDDGDLGIGQRRQPARLPLDEHAEIGAGRVGVEGGEGQDAEHRGRL